jgi:hypothetical protein
MTNSNQVPVMAQYPNGVPLLVALSSGWASANTDITGAIQGNAAGGVNSVLAAAATGQLGLGTGYANSTVTNAGPSAPVENVSAPQVQNTPATVASVPTFNGN